MTVRVWGNPRTICNLNCSFSMHNWKWENLSKMAGKSSSDKKHNKSLRLVLFIPFRCCFAGSVPFSLSTVKQTKLFHSISEMFFTFFSEKNSLSKTFLRVRKYAKFGVFYAKIVQMTPLRLRRESLWLQKFSVNKQGATSTPEIFGNKHSFILTFFATNTIYVNCKRCKP